MEKTSYTANVVEPPSLLFMRIAPAPPALFTVFAICSLYDSWFVSHNTILPLTSIGCNKSQYLPFTSGNNFREKFVGWKADSPSYSAPLPKTATAFIFLSVVLAPTVRIHGAPFSTVPLPVHYFLQSNIQKFPSPSPNMRQ
uniref:Uncharacterized protein n=1 Tax=Solanum lycopersicum TaxID=4081 RepID=A0A3Q7IMM6_SOLLC